MIPRSIVATELTPDAFTPFSEVLEAPDVAGRLHFAADLATCRPGARLNLSLVRAPFDPFDTIRQLEHHPFSAQAFIPLDVESYLVVVALNDERNRPALASLCAFTARPHQCICYRPGIWHLGMTTLRGAGTFVLLVYEDGTADDCRFAPVSPFRLQVLHAETPR